MRRPLQILALSFLVVATTGALDAAPAGATAGFSYPFTSTNEGWYTTTGGNSSPTPATHSSEGNPGGAISVSDSNSPGFDFFISAPSAGGNRSANFGGTLGMDIKSVPDWTKPEDAAVLFGSVNEEEPLCVYSEGILPGSTYQHLEYTLDSEHVYLSDCATHATDAQIAEVLSTFLGFYVIGEDEELTTETTTIDNVSLSGGAPLPQYVLTVVKAGTGTGTVTSNPAGINCGAVCSKELFQGSVMTLKATPAAGSTFAGWSGGGCTGTGACQVTLGGNREVTATFNANPPNLPVTPPVTPKAHKPLTCKKGFKKKRVHGVPRCVRIRHHHHHHHH